MMAAQLQKPTGSTPPQSNPPADPSNEAELSEQLDKATLSDAVPLKNRAAESTSPYLRAHTESPVAWQLLDDEAIQKAKSENKLIFLNIGFRACHYCKLTTQDSFSNSSVASLLNSSFIPIMVDREERPDVDTIYMNYIQAVNGAGGWPLNVFLTPELEPVFGGTYWPGPGTELLGLDGERIPDDERLDFLVILQKMKNVWEEQEARCRQEAKQILSQLREFAAEGTLGTKGISTPAKPATSSAAVPTDLSGGATVSTPGTDLEVDLDQVEEAFTHIAGTFDSVNGGFGLAPKFPTPAKLSFLLRLAHFPTEVHDVVGEKEVEQATHIALHTLRKLRDGGLRDHIGAGFFRYSATVDWTMPHFEKMVLDNALLLGVYLDAWLTTAKQGQLKKEDEFADIVVELADYLTSKSLAGSTEQDSGFATSEAADSFYRKGDKQMREGAYYLWTRREFENVVGDGQTSAVAAAHWDVLQHGNIERDQDPNDEFLNQNVLRVVKNAEELGRQFGIATEEVGKLIASAREKLLAHREKERVHPEIDAKAVASINSMVIAALARTAVAIKSVDGERAEKYLTAAKKATSFIQEKLWDSASKVLYRTYYDGRGSTKGFSEDYAFLIEALLELYSATGVESWLEWADELQSVQIKLFYDSVSTASRPATPGGQQSSCGGFYSTTDDAPQAILRLKDGMDTAQPSTNSVSTSNLFRLGAIFGDSKYTKLARETINAFEVEMLQYPWLFVGLLGSVVTARLGGKCWLVHRTSSASEIFEGDTWHKYHLLPRAGLRSLIFVQPLGGDDWLLKRNPLLDALKDKVGKAFQFNNGSYQEYEETKLD